MTHKLCLGLHASQLAFGANRSHHMVQPVQHATCLQWALFTGDNCCCGHDHRATVVTSASSLLKFLLNLLFWLRRLTQVSTVMLLPGSNSPMVISLFTAFELCLCINS